VRPWCLLIRTVGFNNRGNSSARDKGSSNTKVSLVSPAAEAPPTVSPANMFSLLASLLDLLRKILLIAPQTYRSTVPCFCERHFLQMKSWKRLAAIRLFRSFLQATSLLERLSSHCSSCLRDYVNVCSIRVLAHEA
jgi:hypothetical protein